MSGGGICEEGDGGGVSGVIGGVLRWERRRVSWCLDGNTELVNMAFEWYTLYAGSLSISPVASNRVNLEICYGLYVDMQYHFYRKVLQVDLTVISVISKCLVTPLQEWVACWQVVRI